MSRIERIISDRCRAYCPYVSIDDVDIQYNEIKANEPERNLPKEISEEKLDEILSAEFLRRLDEALCETMNEWLYEQVYSKL